MIGSILDMCLVRLFLLSNIRARVPKLDQMGNEDKLESCPSIFNGDSFEYETEDIVRNRQLHHNEGSVSWLVQRVSSKAISEFMSEIGSVV